MNKYKNRNGKSKILVDKELSGFAETLIYIASGFISPVYVQTNNSNPTSLVCLNPTVKIQAQRLFIGLEQWNTVLSPVVQRVSPLIGKLPASASPLTFKDLPVGYNTYYLESLGSLYNPEEDTLLDLVKKMILKEAQEKGFGT